MYTLHKNGNPGGKIEGKNPLLSCPYSRCHPSKRYERLIALYKKMHQEGNLLLKVMPERSFPGKSLLPHIEQIKALIQKYAAETLLDYGCGKGALYAERHVLKSGISVPSLQKWWGILELRLYDPAYDPYMTLPDAVYHGVISTDVLEHCPVEDLPWIIDEIFHFSGKFVYLHVSCNPAVNFLPDGQNAHCTVKRKKWWDRLIYGIANHYPSLEVVVSYQEVRSHRRRIKARLKTILIGLFLKGKFILYQWKLSFITKFNHH